jgi:hypothetical protein
MGATLYEPINVYKPLAPNIGVVDGPFEYFTVAGILWARHGRTRRAVTLAMSLSRFFNGAQVADDF